MRTLVTGCSGYIGSHVVPTLQSRGIHVTGIDRVVPMSAQPDRFILGDLNDSATVQRALRGVERVIHLAAAKADWGITAGEYFRDNLLATRSLVAAGRASVESWLIFSTVAVYGPSHTPATEEAELRPAHPYGESKLAAEEALRALLGEVVQPKVTVLRPSAVFGPGNPPSTNIYRLIDAIVQRRFVMVGHGEAAKSTSYLENLLAAMLFVLERERPGLTTYNYVDEPVWTTRELVLRICQLSGRPVPRLRIPLGLATRVMSMADVAARITRCDLPITSARIEKFATSTLYDATRLRRAGFVQPASMDEALAATVAAHPSVRATAEVSL
jgi:nucleoside-diphosphate-sugar epimerase